MTAPISFDAGWLIGWLIDYFLLATLFLAATLAARRWIRQPAQRMTLAWIVTLELIVLAAVCATPFWPRASLVRLTPKDTSAAAPRPSNAADADSPGEGPALRTITTVHPNPNTLDSVDPAGESASAAAVPPGQTGLALGATGWAVLLYLAGAAAAAAWLVAGAVAAGRILRRAKPASDVLNGELAGLASRDGRTHRTPRLLISDDVGGAVAMGVSRPAILLPAGWVESSSHEELRAVLAHEWAHVRRGDLWLLALGRVLLVLLFAHPLLWWLRRAIRDDQELLADAAAAGESRHGYAQTLLDLIRVASCPTPLRGSAAVAIWESPTQLSRRIAMLLDDTFRVHPTGSPAWRRRALGLLVLAGVGLSFVTFQPSRSTGQSVPTSEAKETNEKQKAEGRLAIGLAIEMGGESDKSPAKKGDESLARTGGGMAVGRTISTVTMAGRGRHDGPVGYGLPGYAPLMDPEVVKSLDFTKEQKSRLDKIQLDFAKKNDAFLETLKNASLKDVTRAHVRWERDNRTWVRENVEKILTSGQKKTLDEMILQFNALQYLGRLEFMGQDAVATTIGLNKSQRERIAALQQEITRDSIRDVESAHAKAMLVLTPAQRAKLADVVLGPDGVAPFPQSVIPVEIEPGKPEQVMVPMGYPYPDLTLGGVQDELKLTEAQCARVREIVGPKGTIADRLAAEVKKLPPESRKKLRSNAGGILVASGMFVWGPPDADANLSPEQRAKAVKEREEFEKAMRESRRAERAQRESHPLWNACVELRRQLESTLTPEQTTRYKEMALRNVGSYILRDWQVVSTLGLTDKQQATLRAMFRDLDGRMMRRPREVGKKMLDVLTPEQRVRLGDAAERAEAGLAQPAPAEEPAEGALQLEMVVPG